MHTAEEDVTHLDNLIIATLLWVVVALKVDVRGLNHVANSGMAEDGFEGLLRKAMGKLEGSKAMTTNAEQWVV